MRSWLLGMPGEKVSCLGCHETQQEAPLVKLPSVSLRKPADIEPWHGPPRGFSFVREVQPVLDRYCISCHCIQKKLADTAVAGGPGGPGRVFQLPNFTGGVLLTDWSTQMAGHWGGGGKFTTSYAERHRFVRRPGIEGDRRMFTPLDDQRVYNVGFRIIVEP